jgi:hypothetical protein
MNMPNPGTRAIRIDSMESMPPEALLEDFAPHLQAIAQRLREIVTTTLPDAVERVRPGWQLIGYDVPVGRRSVYFAWVWLQPEHVHLGFQHGWAMRDPRGLLQGRGITKRVRWLTFTAVDDVDPGVCAVLLEEAVDVARMSRGERELRSMDATAEG